MPASAAAIVGREAERQILQELFERALAGRGAVALLSGEAGIGKSALAEDFAASAQARGFAVTRGRAWEFAEAPPYFPLWPCIRALGVELESQAVMSEGFRFWERVAEGLAVASARQPIAWVLEDLHAADRQTLELLCFLAQPVRALPVVLVLTARRKDPRLSDQGLRLLMRAARDGVALELAPLPAAQALALAAQSSLVTVAPAAQARFLQLTGGNPLFVVEYAKAMRAAGAQPELPASIRELVLEVRDRLPEPAQRALAAGAVLGREFSAAILARMAGALPARIIDELAPALRAGLIVELAPGRFRWNHDLTREAVYRGCAEQQRLGLHAAAEEALSHGHDEDAALFAERAHHALCAVVPGREAHAIALAQQAAALAETQGAFDRALTLLQRAHQVRHAIAGAAPEQADELLALSSLARRAGMTEAARRLCRSALQLARRARDPRAFARAALQLGAELQPAIVDPELVRTLQEALAGLSPVAPAGAGVREAPGPAAEGSAALHRYDDAGLRCVLSARLAAALQPAPDPSAPLPMARAAIAQALAGDDPRLAVDVLFYGGSALADFAPVAERLHNSRELLQRASVLGDHWRVLTAYARLLMDEAEIGDFEAFDNHLDALLAAAREAGHPRLTWRPLLFASMRAVARGDFAASDRYCVEVERLAGVSEDHMEVEQLASVSDDRALLMSLIAHKNHRTCMSYGADGGTPGLERFSEHMVNVPMWALIWRVTDAFVFGWLQDRQRAAAALAGVPFDAVLCSDVSFMHFAAEAVAVAGTPDQARFLLGALQGVSAPEFAGGHVPITYDGPVGRVRGLLHAVLQDWDNAERELRAALARVRRHGFVPWVARICHELADVLQRSGRAGPAQALWSEARAEAAGIGLGGLVALIDAARAGDAPGVAAATPPPVLTSYPRVTLAREGELWVFGVEQRKVRVRDSRGIQLLARLIERPDEELHVLALCSDEGAALNDSDAGELVDAPALAAYRKRLQHIAALLEADPPPAQAQRLHHERALLQQQVAQAVGLRGLRRAGSTSERARVNVQRRVKDAIKRIGEADAGLGDYLVRAIRTGTYCSFRP